VKAAIQLAEQPGFRYHAPIVNCDPVQVYEGMAVELVWLEPAGVPVAAFQPASPE
jgi:uncharacterized OB-fold protein